MSTTSCFLLIISVDLPWAYVAIIDIFSFDYRQTVSESGLLGS